MGHRVAVLRDGLLQQCDTPHALYHEPANLFVAGFIGSPAMNFFPAKLAKDGDKVIVDTGDFKVQIPADHAAPYKGLGGKDVIFGIRPENIHDPDFAPPNIHGEKVLAKVDVTELMGNETLVYLVSGKNIFVGRVDPRSKLRVNDSVQLVFDMDKFHIFDAASEAAVR